MRRTEEEKSFTLINHSCIPTWCVLSTLQSWELLNTAVLSGKQVSMPLKVFIVSYAGKVADVTLQSSCSTEDETALKVS
jgi:transmembrane protein 132